MSRSTRGKAAQPIDQVQIHEDALVNEADHKAQHPAPDLTERPPLSEIAPNTSSNKEVISEAVETAKPTGNKKSSKKRAKAGKKDANAQAVSITAENTEPLDILPDKNESAPSPASEAAADDLMKEVPELETTNLPVHDIKADSPPSKAVQLTRSQLGSSTSTLRSQEPKSLKGEKIGLSNKVQRSTGVPNQPRGAAQTGAQKHNLEPNANVPKSLKRVPSLSAETSVSHSPTSMPNNLQNTISDLPDKITTLSRNNMDVNTDPPMNLSESQSSTKYDRLEDAAVHANPTPTKSPAASTPRLEAEDPIAALDDLEDAVEQVNAEVPDVQTSPQKPKVKRDRVAPVVRTTKAAMARISMAHGPKDTPRPPALGRPRQSNGGAQPKRVISNASATSSTSSNADAVEKKEVVIPHSKPRPMSMSFPTPPPPAKSSKVATKSTFQLPGEAVAAKFKAAKDARLAKEAEEKKKQPFKARPVPTNRPAAVRQTSTSKAREGLMGGTSVAPTAAFHKRASSAAASTRPTSVSRSASTRATPSVSRSASTRATPAVKSTTAASSKAAAASKRLSTIPTEASNSRRASTAFGVSAASSASTTRPASVAHARGLSGTAKGKEVFNRAAQAKSAAEKEKREKEEAAKKARAEAAERSRQKSREWAEKQKARKGESKVAGETAVADAGLVETPAAPPAAGVQIAV